MPYFPTFKKDDQGMFLDRLTPVEIIRCSGHLSDGHVFKTIERTDNRTLLHWLKTFAEEMCDIPFSENLAAYVQHQDPIYQQALAMLDAQLNEPGHEYDDEHLRNMLGDFNYFRYPVKLLGDDYNSLGTAELWALIGQAMHGVEQEAIHTGAGAILRAPVRLMGRYDTTFSFELDFPAIRGMRFDYDKIAAIQAKIQARDPSWKHRPWYCCEPSCVIS